MLLTEEVRERWHNSVQLIHGGWTWFTNKDAKAPLPRCHSYSGGRVNDPVELFNVGHLTLAALILAFSKGHRWRWSRSGQGSYDLANLLFDGSPLYAAAVRPGAVSVVPTVKRRFKLCIRRRGYMGC